MTTVCQACGKGVSEGRKVRSLKEVELPSMVTGDSIHLCGDCFETRRMRSWSADEAERGQVEHALTKELHKPAHRFTYLKDDEKNIHLVRVRPDWIEREHDAPRAAR